MLNLSPPSYLLLSSSWNLLTYGHQYYEMHTPASAQILEFSLKLAFRQFKQNIELCSEGGEVSLAFWVSAVGWVNTQQRQSGQLHVLIHSF